MRLRRILAVLGLFALVALAGGAILISGQPGGSGAQTSPDYGLDSGIVKLNTDPSPGFMRVWVDGTLIEGDVDIASMDREGTILITELHHEINIPIDKGTGLPTGSREHQPLTVTTLIDKSTPLLSQALADGGQVEVEIRLFAIDGTGQEVHYFTMALQDALIVSMRPFIPNTLDPDNAPMGHMFELSFVYGTMSYVHEETGAVFQDGPGMP